jgi:hypothetical protein
MPGASASIFNVLSGTKKFFVVTFIDDAGIAAFFAVHAASSVLRLFCLRTSLKSYSRGALFFRTSLRSFSVIEYAPCSALWRALQQVSRLSSAELLTSAHSSLLPTETGVLLARFSTSHKTFNNWCTS